MLSFIYTYSEVERPKRNGHTHKTVRVFRVKRNKVVLIAEGTDTYVSEFQLVLQTLEAHRLIAGLPLRAYDRNPMGGWTYGTAWALKEAGIADIQRVS